MDNLIIKIKEMYNHNKLGIISLLFFSVLINLEFFLIDKNFSGIAVIIVILTCLAYFVNEIIIIKKYISNRLNDFPDIEYNNYFIIIIQVLKIYVIYFLLAFIISIILGIVFLFKDSIGILFAIVNYNYNDLLPEDYISAIINSKTLPLFYYIVILLIFFKLLFIMHILIFKQENYKIKNIINKSKSIIQADKIFFIIAYFGDNLFQYLGGEMILKNNYIFPIIWSIVDVLLFMIYLIKFSDIKKLEYDKIYKNLQENANEDININKNVNSNNIENDSDTIINDKWICSKCGTANEIFLPSCKKCGKEINKEE
jgi:hypothetical protein